MGKPVFNFNDPTRITRSFDGPLLGAARPPRRTLTKHPEGVDTEITDSPKPAMPRDFTPVAIFKHPSGIQVRFERLGRKSDNVRLADPDKAYRITISANKQLIAEDWMQGGLRPSDDHAAYFYNKHVLTQKREEKVS